MMRAVYLHYLKGYFVLMSAGGSREKWSDSMLTRQNRIFWGMPRARL